jgi:hypothetical protein
MDRAAHFAFGSRKSLSSSLRILVGRRTTLLRTGPSRPARIFLNMMTCAGVGLITTRVRLFLNFESLITSTGQRFARGVAAC